MTVRFYMMRKDIPDDCAYDVCKDMDAYTFSQSGYGPVVNGVRLNVSYLWDDLLQSRYPQLYPDYLDGKTGRRIGGMLARKIISCRRRELHGLSDWMLKDDKRRLGIMLSGLNEVAHVLADHPDWKLVLES